MEATYIEVEAEVRYWEDATVNGQEDTEGKLIPFRFGSEWCPIIRLEDGRIIGWPEGTTADIHYKVCDQGEYWISDESGKNAKWRGDYVPDKFLCHGDTGYGDYIIFKVGPDGFIQGWTRPEIDPDQWDFISDAIDYGPATLGEQQMTETAIVDELKAMRELLAGLTDRHMDRLAVAERLNVHPTTLDRWVKAGSFPRPKNGRWLLSDVMKWERDR